MLHDLPIAAKLANVVVSAGVVWIAGMLGILVTAICMAGLLERRDPTIFAAGCESIAVGITDLAGISLLFFVRRRELPARLARCTGKDMSGAAREGLP